ncbi:hypothetical protein INS49_008929 [Diaporthe citri]|uniref:uncharacterized protein n=1 Tax=Diaporthe citri TaxID=83186 RepID=UPI001C7F606B|nr:uncharacterized protein INS49_008929 [Diaporthe citri]KAG6363826.1 hypothetical protein INS49_008929 [Diaporthe citri]
MPAASRPGLSAYTASKLALSRLIKSVEAEQQQQRISTVAVQSWRHGPTSQLPVDAPCLPEHFLVWMASPEACYLHGRTVWANWDVDELKAQGGEGLRADPSRST